MQLIIPLLSLISLSFQNMISIKCEKGKYLISKNHEIYIVQNKGEEKISFMPDPQFLDHAKKQYKIEKATQYENDIYFLGKDFIIFSQNCVQTYQIYDIPKQFEEIEVNNEPHKPDQEKDHHYDIVGLHRLNKKGDHDLYDVYMSCNNGQEWELIEQKVKYFSFKNYNLIKQQVHHEQIANIPKLQIMKFIKIACIFFIIFLFLVIFRSHIHYVYRVIESKIQRQKNYPTFRSENVKYQNIDYQKDNSIYN